MSDSDWKTTVFDKDGDWHGTTRDVEEMAKENTRELWRRMHDTGDDKKYCNASKKPGTEKEKKEMETETIIYVYKEVIDNDGCPYCLEGKDLDLSYGRESLCEIAKDIIDNIAEGELKGKINIITRPPERILLDKDEVWSERYEPLSKKEREELRQYFNIGRIVG